MNRIAQAPWRGFALGGLIALASCTQTMPETQTPEVPGAGHMGADFGNAVSHNAAQHIVDPVPRNALAGAPALDGARAADAYRRYRTGTVIAPAAVETTNFGTDR